MNTPSVQLSTQIVDQLIKEGLFKASDTKLVPSLADGKMKQEDWQLTVELAMQSEVKK